MGATKNEIHSKELIEMAEMLKAIAHPARLKALFLIANETDSEVTTQDILKQIKLSQSTMSRHLKQLSDSGLVKTKLIARADKSCLCYRINKPAFDQFQKMLNYLDEKIGLKIDDKFEYSHLFYSKFHAIENWNRCFSS